LNIFSLYYYHFTWLEELFWWETQRFDNRALTLKSYSHSN
jgi:hypothetical protein